MRLLNAFPSLFPHVERLLVPDTVILLKCKCSRRDDGETAIVCEGIATEQELSRFVSSRQLCCKIADSERAKMQQIMEVLKKYPGSTPFCFWMKESRRYLRSRTCTGVAVSAELTAALEKLIPLQDCALIEQRPEH